MNTDIQTPDQATIEAAEKLLAQAKSGEVVGIAYVAIGPESVGYGLAGEVISGGLNVLGMLRLIEYKLIGQFDGVLDLVDETGTLTA